MESCIRISLSEYIDPDQSQRFDHSGRNEIWREPFPPARTCDRWQGLHGQYAHVRPEGSLPPTPMDIWHMTDPPPLRSITCECIGLSPALIKSLVIAWP